jgi:hypothetical protein
METQEVLNKIERLKYELNCRFDELNYKISDMERQLKEDKLKDFKNEFLQELLKSEERLKKYVENQIDETIRLLGYKIEDCHRDPKVLTWQDIAGKAEKQIEALKKKRGIKDKSGIKHIITFGKPIGKAKGTTKKKEKSLKK